MVRNSCCTRLRKKQARVLKRADEYNEIISEVYGYNLIKISKQLLDNKGYNIDNIHWNKRGHEVVEKILLEKINCYFKC